MDGADEFIEFALRYEEAFRGAVRNRMKHVGIPDEAIGHVDEDSLLKLFDNAGFNPHASNGGGVVPRQGISVDAGVLNSNLINSPAWKNARLRDRIDAVLAHEYAEFLHGTHEAALRTAPNIGLNISEAARLILREMLGGN